MRNVRPASYLESLAILLSLQLVVQTHDIDSFVISIAGLIELFGLHQVRCLALKSVCAVVIVKAVASQCRLRSGFGLSHLRLGLGLLPHVHTRHSTAAHHTCGLLLHLSELLGGHILHHATGLAHHLRIHVLHHGVKLSGLVGSPFEILITHVFHLLSLVLYLFLGDVTWVHYLSCLDIK